MGLSLDNRIQDDKRKLITWLALVLGLGFIGTALISYYASRDSIRESIIHQELPLTSDNIYSEIQKDLVRPILISSMMASDTFLHDWVEQGEANKEAIRKYLNEVKVRYGVITSFFVSDHSQSYYHPEGVLKNIHTDAVRDIWYYRVRDMEAPYEINVDIDLGNNDALTIFVNYRVLNSVGEFIGATGVGLTVDTVHRLVRDYQMRYQRKIYFVDKSGTVVLEGGDVQSQGRTISGTPGLQALAAQILQSQEGAFQYSQEGRLHLLNVRYIPELNWYLFVEKSEEEALFSVRKTLYVNLVISLTIMGLVLLLTNWVIGRYQRRLEQMASIDKLTNLLNRQAFDLLAEHALRESLRSRGPISIVLLDLDHFKQINDRHGHLAGDAVIREVAELLQSVMRDSDILSRWGGEEFLALLKGCDLHSAEAVAEKFRTAIRAHEFSFNGHPISMTASIGVAQYDGQESLAQFFARADQALYEAKHSGRDCVSVST